MRFSTALALALTALSLTAPPPHRLLAQSQQWRDLRVFFVSDSQCKEMGASFMNALPGKIDAEFVARGQQIYTEIRYDCVSYRMISECHNNDPGFCGLPWAETGAGAVREWCKSNQVRSGFGWSLLGMKLSGSGLHP